MSDSCDLMDCTKFLCPWDFSGKKTGVGCHFLFQVTVPPRKPYFMWTYCQIKSNIVKGDDAGLKDRGRTQGDRFPSQHKGNLGQE